MTSTNRAQGDRDIEEISERLVSLANQINRSNTARRGDRLPARPAGEHLPSFFRTPAKNQRPRTFARETDLGTSGLPRNANINPKSPPALDADGQGWPQLPIPEIGIQALEEKIAEQSAELYERSIEIAELCIMRQTQAGESKIARHEIETLRQSIAEFQHIAAQHEVKAAAATQKLIRSEGEKAVLQGQLNEELNTSTELSHRLLDIEATLNDKIVDLASHQEAVERLKAELAAAQTETNRKVAAAEEIVDLRHCEERKLQIAGYEKRIAEVQALTAERDRQLSRLKTAYAELAACCDGLSRKVVALEGAQQQAGAAIHSQSEYIVFLETMLKVERENSQSTLRELVAEFERERQQHQVRERESAEIRKNIVLLLPKLSARRNAETEPEPDAAVAHTQVA